MFTGIIETLGRVKKIKKDQGNTHFTIQTTITNELKIDQSVAHNGVCLTVVEIFDDNYVVTAIKETLDKTNLDKLSVNEEVNIERAMKLGDRLDGHIVQGHVDQIAVCAEIIENDGSWIFTFSYDSKANNITIEKVL
jgi:Riboflavin synthase alpha chain